MLIREVIPDKKNQPRRIRGLDWPEVSEVSRNVIC
jgi:hypothetical protein